MKRPGGTHRTPQYVVDRFRDKSYRRRHPDQPWLNRDAINVIDGWLRPGDSVLEFGAGRSTSWFATRVRHVVSFESSPSWIQTVTTEVAGRGAGAKVTVELHDTDYGSRDFAIDDPEGNHWYFGTYRGAPRPS